MALLDKIDSNLTGLRFAEEASIGLLDQEKASPTNTDWVPLEPNTYSDFGGSITTVARNPINSSRQRKKGVTTDKDSSGAFNTDLTQKNLQLLLQGFFFADLRRKGEEVAASVTIQAGDDTYEVASTTGFFVGSLVFATGFTNAENNGLKIVTAVVADTSIAVVETLVTEVSPPASNNLVVVGFQFDAGDLDVDDSGTLPVLTTTVKDLTELGMLPGEWLYSGGDSASLAFTNVDGSGNLVNNGFMRARLISTNSMSIDKSDFNLTTEASTAETIQVFLGRVLRNELGTLIKRRTYNLERTLGFPDDSLPAEVQAEYLIGAVPNELTLNVATADKINADLTFVAINTDSRTGPQTNKSDDANATKITLEEADAFNTSSDFTRIKLAKVVPGDEAPTPLFAFVTELTITINNNNSPNKAVGVLGAFEVTSGTFQIGGSTTAYFADVTSVDAVQDNDDVTLDFSIVKDNAGITIDIPLLSLGDGRPVVEQDAAITLPLTLDAATAAKIDPTLDYTLHAQFYDFLPNVAAV